MKSSFSRLLPDVPHLLRGSQYLFQGAGGIDAAIHETDDLVRAAEAYACVIADICTSA